MQEEPKRRMSARARKVVGIATGVAVAATAATAVALLPSSANADENPAALIMSNGWGKLPPVPPDAEERAVAHKDLPPGAERATKGPARPGARARAFESSAKRVRVVNGKPVSAADFTGVVGIRAYYVARNESGVPVWYVGTCTGSVLSPTRVLTAAHCTVDLNYAAIEVIAGRDNLDNDGVGHVAQVSHTWTHQGYNAEEAMYGNERPLDDVSVLTLKEPLPAVYTPVKLADQGAPDPAADSEATIVGYGVTGEKATDSGTLRAATVKIASDATCAQQYGARFDRNRMMCAGDPPTDTCAGDSGGPLFTGTLASRVQVGITDWGDGCGDKLGVYEALNHYSNVVKQQITITPANNLDWTGDGHSDLIMRDRKSGNLWVGSGAGLVFGTPEDGFEPGISGKTDGLGARWNGYTKLFRVNNWSGDKTPSIFARDKAGKLFNWRSDGRGAFVGTPQQIGSGWNMFTDIMVTNNWTGNGLPNLMGRTADGRLVIYNSNGKGGWSNPRGTQIGTGWTRFNTVLTPGSWLGDGKQSLIGRTPAGELVLYNSNGQGGWTNPRGTSIGTGWGGFPTFMSPGDFNGDNLVDLLGVRNNGQLMMYATNGKGAWLNGRGTLLGSDWDYFNTIF